MPLLRRFWIYHHIIPPKQVPLTEKSIEFEAIDVGLTVGVGSTAHLYLYGKTNKDAPPENVIEDIELVQRQKIN
ncbi:MAG: hypothetical protein CM15mV12_3090 [uncultured marine virus]|nr:MAG: hypothetical protein CM15mV12_3090 [uncultured marine virus]